MNVKDYEARLRQLPCLVGYVMGLGCRTEELHHVGDPVDHNDWAQVGLCHEHHQGATGIHGLHRRVFHMRYQLSDVKMLALTRELYAKEYDS